MGSKAAGRADPHSLGAMGADGTGMHPVCGAS